MSQTLADNFTDVIPASTTDESSAVSPADQQAQGFEVIGYWHRASSYVLDTGFILLVSFGGSGATALLMRLLQQTFGLSGFVSRSQLVEMLAVFFPLIFPLFYFVMFEWLYGATPGKVISRLRVVRTDGTPCTLKAALLRGLLRYIDGMFFTLPAAIVMANSYNQRWGDKLAHTYVLGSRDAGIVRRRPWRRFWLAAALVLLSFVFWVVLLLSVAV